MSGQLLTTRQVAKRLGLSPETVLRRWRAGQLPGFRLASNCLRFDPDDIDEWLERTRNVAATAAAPRTSFATITSTCDGRGD